MIVRFSRQKPFLSRMLSLPSPFVFDSGVSVEVIDEIRQRPPWSAQTWNFLLKVGGGVQKPIDLQKLLLLLIFRFEAYNILFSYPGQRRKEVDSCSLTVPLAGG